MLFLLLCAVTVAHVRAESWRINFNNNVCGGGGTEKCNEYDYIVVGAGASGSVVASQLSADPSNSVLLLEQGGYSRNPDIHKAADWFGIQFNPEIELGYESTPQAELLNADGTPGRVERLPRAAVTGGCQSHNGMVFIYGNTRDYDKWANDYGNPGWDAASLQPYWEQILNTFNGKISVPSRSEPFYEDLITAAGAQGYRFNADPNLGTRGRQVGVSVRRYMNTVDPGGESATRRSAWTEMIETVSATRSNLDIRVFDRATRVIFHGNTAVGVEVTNIGSGKKSTFYAKKEVILSGGVVGSPQLLLLSGVGPRADLQNLGIPVVHDLPGVGKGMQNHLFIPLFGPAFVNQSAALPSFRHGGTGLIMIGPDNGTPEGNLPSLYQVISAGNAFRGPSTAKGFSCWVEPLAIAARGSLKLKSSNPNDAPLIDPNWLGTEADRQNAIAGFKSCRQLFANPALSQYTTGDELWPGPQVVTDAQILEHIRKDGTDDFHLIGGANMGPSSNPNAVVDNRLRVHGLNNLRVVDNSVQPLITSGNPAQPAMLIGMKGAKMIMEDN